MNNQINMDSQFKFLENIFEEYQAIVKKFYPNIISNGMGYSGPNFHYDFSPYCKHYIKTPFYYNDNLKFVHWTTVTNLSSIINNSEIRLYNLDNSEDIDEFIYAGKLLTLSAKQVEIIKKNYFTTSFCSFENLENEFLWKTYGRDYRGVAIVFSIIDNRDEWENFFLSRVYYELDPTFEKFHDEIEKLKKHSNNLTFNTDIWRFAGFYKKNHFQNEHEVRLACIFPFHSETDNLRYIRKELKIEKNRNRIVRYIPLKLWTDPESSYFRTLDIDKLSNNSFEYNKPELPKIKIDSVYFGKNCGLSNDEYFSFSNDLKEIFEWRLGYRIELPLNLYD